MFNCLVLREVRVAAMQTVQTEHHNMTKCTFGTLSSSQYSWLFQCFVQMGKKHGIRIAVLNKFYQNP